MIAPARRAAVDALQLIDEDGLDLGAAVARLRDTLSDERDRALLLELVGGTLRMRGAIDYQVQQRLTRPLHKLDAAVLRILRVSGFQLLYLSRLPASAVINDAVELTRRSGKTSAAGLTNAVLRALNKERETLSWPRRERLAEHLAVVHSHPQWLVERWLSRYGADATERWLRFNNTAAGMCLATNTVVTNRDALAFELAQAGVETRPTTRAAHGLVVVNGRALATAAFRDGKFVVQDEASQLIAALPSPPPGARALDLCASPGGKTMAMSAAVGGGGVVVACDVRPNRLRLLARTLSRCRAQNVRVVHVPAAGPLPFRPASFDAVLIDAPCSGLGTVRRDPDIKWKRSPADLARFAAGQRELLASGAVLVKPGGRLIYATCSSEPEENQDVADAFLAAQPDFVLVHTHQTLPSVDDLEAFFAVVLERAHAPAPPAERT